MSYTSIDWLFIIAQENQFYLQCMLFHQSCYFMLACGVGMLKVPFRETYRMQAHVLYSEISPAACDGPLAPRSWKTSDHLSVVTTVAPLTNSSYWDFQWLHGPSLACYECTPVCAHSEIKFSLQNFAFFKDNIAFCFYFFLKNKTILLSYHWWHTLKFTGRVVLVNVWCQFRFLSVDCVFMGKCYRLFLFVCLCVCCFLLFVCFV
jgi:hypothetical protein